MAKIHELLSENPISFNELLDLFEAYVSPIAEPLHEAVHLIRDELNYQSGDIFQHICGVSFFFRRYGEAPETHPSRSKCRE